MLLTARARGLRPRAVDGQRKYAPNPVQQFLDQMLALIEEHERDPALRDRRPWRGPRLRQLPGVLDRVRWTDGTVVGIDR